MKALKFLKHMKQTDTPYNFRECEINEAIEELEAIKLTRREWYQKGFNEAMKPKTCDECEWWDFNSYGIFKKCFNGKGNCVSTKSSFGCNRFKQKDNA